MNPRTRNQPQFSFAFFAKFISVVFHPLLVTTYIFILLLLYTPTLLAPWSNNASYILLWMIFTGTFLLPLLIVFLFFYDRDKSLNEFLLMRNYQLRHKPFILTSIIYAGVAFTLYQQLRINSVVVTMVAIIAFSVFIAGVINYWWKISMHAVGISGLAGFTVVLHEKFAGGELLVVVLATFIISGLVLSARLYLNEHSPKQVYAGWILGFFLSSSSQLIFTIK